MNNICKFTSCDLEHFNNIHEMRVKMLSSFNEYIDIFNTVDSSKQSEYKKLKDDLLIWNIDLYTKDLFYEYDLMYEDSVVYDDDTRIRRDGYFEKQKWHVDYIGDENNDFVCILTRFLYVITFKEHLYYNVCSKIIEEISNKEYKDFLEKVVALKIVSDILER
jgi:hypothetical protein